MPVKLSNTSVQEQLPLRRAGVTWGFMEGRGSDLQLEGGDR